MYEYISRMWGSVPVHRSAQNFDTIDYVRETNVINRAKFVVDQFSIFGAEV